MSVIKAIILGLVAGVTDFLPVSSSGHLALFANILGVEGEIDFLFIVAVHIGTMIAVILAYFSQISKTLFEIIGFFKDIAANIRTLFSKSPDKAYRRLVTGSYRKLAVMVLIALIPTAILGFFVMALSESLSGNLMASGVGLMITALILLVASFSGRSYKGPHEAKYVDAVLIGAFQGFSVFPGVSRIALTVSSAKLNGFTSKFALLFSFILFIPSVIGSFIVESIRSGSIVSNVGVGYTLIAIVVAAVVGYFILRILKKLLSNTFSKFFALYCFIIGLVSIIYYIV